MPSDKSKIKPFLLLSLLALGAGFLLVNLHNSSATVLAAGPTQSPGTGSGALATDASGNLGIGAVPSSSVKLLIQAPNALSTNYALSVIKQNGTAIIQAGNDGTVTIPGLVGGATVNANNVSAGQFGANTGNGNFSFPASVGIATTSPNAPLEVLDPSSNKGIRITSGAGSSALNLYTTDATAGNRNWTIRNRYNAYGLLEFAYGASLGADPSIIAMAITNAGNVGIGTSTTPGANLTVQQSNNSQNTAGLKLIASGLPDDFSIFEGGDHNSYLWNGGTGGMTMWVNNGTQAMTIATSGNVGIGTAVPAQKLSVVGTVESTSGGFKFPDGTTQTTAAAAGATPHVQFFTSNGTWTWPAGVSVAWVTVCGGGGGGSGSWNSIAGGGGGGAACFLHYPVAVSANVSVTIGSAGAGGSPSVSGGNGTASSFGTVSANGGYGGFGGGNAGWGGTSGGGVPYSLYNSSTYFAINGSADTMGSTGAPGGSGFFSGLVVGVTGGSMGSHLGGRGQYFPDMNTGSGSYGGGGGASSMGNGGAGGTGGGAGQVPASGYGGGGGGGAIGPGGATGYSGGAGAPGIVIVEWMQ